MKLGFQKWTKRPSEGRPEEEEVYYDRGANSGTELEVGREGVQILDIARGGPDLGALEKGRLRDKMERIPSPGTQAVPLWKLPPSPQNGKSFSMAEERGDQQR